MNKIKKFNTLKNVNSFPRLFDKAGKRNAEYFIDSNHYIDSFERLLNKSNIVNSPDASVNVGGNMSGTNFKNDISIKMISTKKNDYTLYSISGICSTMTEEQQRAWSSEAVMGQTDFVVIGYATNFTNAYKRRTGWVEKIDDATISVKNLPEDGYQTTVLGINGPGTVNTKKSFYRVDIIDDKENIIATYVFDVSKLYKGE